MTLEIRHFIGNRNLCSKKKHGMYITLRCHRNYLGTMQHFHFQLFCLHEVLTERRDATFDEIDAFLLIVNCVSMQQPEKLRNIFLKKIVKKSQKVVKSSKNCLKLPKKSFKAVKKYAEKV